MNPVPTLSFGEAIDKVFMKNFANFNGRARRSEFWLWILFCVLIVWALGVPYSIWSSYHINPKTLKLTSRIPVLIMIIFYINIGFNLVTFIPTLAVAVRRLHDIGKSGWWILIVLIPIVGQLILIIMLCFDSVKETNEWGVSPKYPSGNSEIQEPLLKN